MTDQGKIKREGARPASLFERADAAFGLDPANAANTLSTAGYATWGAHVDLRWNDATRLTLRGRNLGDRSHAVYALGSTMVYLGDPRSWELVLRRTF